MGTRYPILGRPICLSDSGDSGEEEDVWSGDEDSGIVLEEGELWCGGELWRR